MRAKVQVSVRSLVEHMASEVGSGMPYLGSSDNVERDGTISRRRKEG